MRISRSLARTLHRLQEGVPVCLDQVGANVPADLDVQLVLDNYVTHKTKPVRDWLAKRPRWHVHFTPTSASWLRARDKTVGSG